MCQQNPQQEEVTTPAERKAVCQQNLQQEEVQFICQQGPSQGPKQSTPLAKRTGISTEKDKPMTEKYQQNFESIEDLLPGARNRQEQTRLK